MISKTLKEIKKKIFNQLKNPNQLGEHLNDQQGSCLIYHRMLISLIVDREEDHPKEKKNDIPKYLII
jgi:hypothetical protein